MKSKRGNYKGSEKHTKDEVIRTSKLCTAVLRKKKKSGEQVYVLKTVEV